MICYGTYEGFTAEDVDRSVLKDGRGVIKTQSLFLEAQSYKLREKYPPLYSLTEEERGGLPSAYQIYMACVDEYEAAMKLVGSLRHWRRLCGLDWFMDGIPEKMFEGLTQWREDMNLRDASRSRRQLQKAASNGDVSSARKLLDSAVPKSQKAPVGRPKDDKTEKPNNGKAERLKQLGKKTLEQ